MAYSDIEQYTLDLNIFFKDNKKIIHIASGGGKLPVVLLSSDRYNDTFEKKLMQLPPKFNIKINPKLSNMLKLKDEELAIYLSDFIEVAKRGIYSYDKTQLGDYDNMEFHLVAKPIQKRKIKVDDTKLIKVNTVLTDEFEIFNLENIDI